MTIPPHKPIGNSAQKPHWREWATSVSFTIALMVLINASIGGAFPFFPFVTIGSIVCLATLFHFMLPGSRFFTLVFVNLIGVYSCVFVFQVDNHFRDVPEEFLAFGFVLPILGFLIGILARRNEIARVIRSGKAGHETEFTHAFGWLIPLAMIVIATFVIPSETQTRLGTTYVFLIAMGLVAMVVLIASRSVAIFLIDTGILFHDFSSIARQLIKPAFAFSTFYTLIIIIFAAFYTLIGRYDGQPTFMISGTPGDLNFLEGLYFSIVTLSTVGYGDITPITHPIRVVAAVQILAGILLLMFGVHAIINYSKEHQK